MASPMHVIYKVNQFLYSRQTPTTFLECQKFLVERHILSETEVEHHHDEIRSRYVEWRECFEAQHGGNHQPQPEGPPTPESLVPHTAPPSIPPSSPPGGAPGATSLDGLKEALERIDPEWPFKGAAATTLFLPRDPNNLSKQVNRKKTLSTQSYIRAQTLEKYGIRCEGRTIDLQWKGPPVPPDLDECMQDTCFVVVDEAVAKEAGFYFDMLVGADHGRPLLEQIRAVRAEDAGSAGSAGSSISDQTEDLSTRSFGPHSFGDSRSAELHPVPHVHRSPPSDVRISISGSPEVVADLIKCLGVSGTAGRGRCATRPDT